MADTQQGRNAPVFADRDLALCIDDLCRDVRTARACAIREGRAGFDGDRDGFLSRLFVVRENLIEQPVAVRRDCRRVHAKQAIHAGRPVGRAAGEVYAPITEPRRALGQVELDTLALPQRTRGVVGRFLGVTLGGH